MGHSRVESRKPDQLVNLITLKFFDLPLNVLKLHRIDQVYETQQYHRFVMVQHKSLWQ